MKRTILVLILFIMLTGLVHSQTKGTNLMNDPNKVIAAALLPLPEAMRATATVVTRTSKGFGPVVRKGSGDMVCAYDTSVENTFSAQCYNETIFAVMKREDELIAGSSANAKLANDTIDKEIKSGTLKLPDHPTMGFQMRGPLASYNSVTNTVDSKQITSWQMVIVPYSTGKTFALPEQRTEGMPWVMAAGTWISHIMIQH